MKQIAILLSIILSGCATSKEITPDFIEHQHDRFGASYTGQHYENTQSFFMIESNKYSPWDEHHNTKENFLYYLQFDLSTPYNYLTK